MYRHEIDGDLIHLAAMPYDFVLSELREAVRTAVTALPSNKSLRITFEAIDDLSEE